MTDPMSPEELRACRERAEAATPGDLSVAREDEDHGAITYAVVRGGLTLAFVPEDTRGKWEHSSAKADATFWASARADVLRLLATIAAIEARAESAELGCDIAYRREPTQAEGDAHEYRHEQSMGPSFPIPECHVPMGNHHGHRCRCSRWVWGGPTICQRCTDAEAVSVVLARAEKAEEKAQQCERDWYDAKAEFGSAIQARDEQIARLKDALVANAIEARSGSHARDSAACELDDIATTREMACATRIFGHDHPEFHDLSHAGWVAELLNAYEKEVRK